VPAIGSQSTSQLDRPAPATAAAAALAISRQQDRVPGEPIKIESDRPVRACRQTDPLQRIALNPFLTPGQRSFQIAEQQRHEREALAERERIIRATAQAAERAAQKETKRHVRHAAGIFSPEHSLGAAAAAAVAALDQNLSGAPLAAISVRTASLLDLTAFSATPLSCCVRAGG
jgi:hypothetical protein